MSSWVKRHGRSANSARPRLRVIHVESSHIGFCRFVQARTAWWCLATTTSLSTAARRTRAKCRWMWPAAWAFPRAVSPARSTTRAAASEVRVCPRAFGPSGCPDARRHVGRLPLFAPHQQTPQFLSARILLSLSLSRPLPPGKQDRPCILATAAAVGAWKTGRPVRLNLPRRADMQMMGGRHPFRCDYKLGCTRDGKMVAFKVSHLLHCRGHSLRILFRCAPDGTLTSRTSPLRLSASPRNLRRVS